MVAEVGFEPTRGLTSLDFESSTSASSITRPSVDDIICGFCNDYYTTAPRFCKGKEGRCQNEGNAEAEVESFVRPRK